MPACSLCGEANPAGALLCRVCGASLSAATAEGVQPTPALLGTTESPAGLTDELVLVHEASGRQFVGRPGQTVGRGSKADVVLAGLPDDGYISEVHARIERRGGRWRIECLGRTNPLKVDGLSLEPSGGQAGLVDGTRVALAKTELRVRCGAAPGGGAKA